MDVGWTWMSLNVEAADMSVGAVFASVTSGMVTGDHVKSQLAFAHWYEGFGFFGSLNSVGTDSMYAIKMTNPATFTFSGAPVSLPKTISITSGWTFLPNPYQSQTPLANALPSGLALELENQVKSQLSFSFYYPGYGWFGSLASFTPGWGYMLLLASAGGDATFQPARRRRVQQQRSASLQTIAGAVAPPQAPREWAEFRPAEFAKTMSITALVSLHGVNRTSGVLAALVADEVRGVQGVPVSPPFGPLAGVHLYLLTVHADAGGERISFALHDGSRTTALDQTLLFEADGRVGGALAPLLLAAGQGARCTVCHRLRSPE